MQNVYNTVRPLDQEYREAFLIVAVFYLFMSLFKKQEDLNSQFDFYWDKQRLQ